MRLGSPEDQETRWKDSEINTPTFQLTPIEKPDMSPFLFHMTGKNQIINILQDGEEGFGYLKASIPEAAMDLKSFQNLYEYDATVVCFTESPTFALDFFRYRSFRRWENDQRFGIGFDKTQLIERGIRPVFYAEDNLIKNLIILYKIVQKLDEHQQPKSETQVKVITSIKTIYPLLFPLMEKHPKQGFMWER